MPTTRRESGFYVDAPGIERVERRLPMDRLTTLDVAEARARSLVESGRFRKAIVAKWPGALRVLTFWRNRDGSIGSEVNSHGE
jgi:hypothetical protein